MGGAGERDGGEPPAGTEEDSIPPPSSMMDPARALGAWRTWLVALATDAEAALAAAMTYAALEGEGRDTWLEALERDRDSVAAPYVALYAPLLAVEANDGRRARIQQAMEADPRTHDERADEGEGHFSRASGSGAPPPLAASPPTDLTRRAPTLAFRGLTRSGDAVCALSTPLYLDFVELLVCRYHPDRGVSIALHEPFRHADQISAFVAAAIEQPVELTAAPLRDVIEELAHAVVADRRLGRVAPDTLARFSHLFGPDLEEDRQSA